MQPPTTQTVYDLFNSRIQFRVPAYQRAYVWNEVENWAVMWDDIEDTANRHFEETEGGVRERHFLGPIVLHQEPFEAGGVDPRVVIDGQQRLMTLQLILSATISVAREHGNDDVADELAELTANRGKAAEGALRFKVWPSRRDRTAFLATVQDGAADGGIGIPGAWKYFRDQIEDWITAEGEASREELTTRSWALKVCLDSLLYVVSINLDASDNAQVIFETLNARGTGLGALDLVKNAIFLQGVHEGVATDQLYDGAWEPTFEIDDYWLEETRQGREKRVRSDWFLMHWLAMELGDVFRADKLFDIFRKKVLRADDPTPIVELVPTICNDARIMRSFDDFEPGTPEQLFFSRMDALDTTTMLPIALFLFRTTELTEEQRRRALAALESWLVRRAIVRLTAKNYNRTLASLIKAVQDAPANADAAVMRELRSSQADTAIWPSDQTIRQRLEENDLYGYVSQARVRMLLEACELDVRDTARTEAIALPAGLSIEHALPQSWEDNWPVADGADWDQAAEVRKAHVHRLGNLTLITQPLNASLSNAPWVAENGGYSKRDELQKRSVLLINQQLVRHDSWDEQKIDERGADLTARILRTWPGPHSDLWPATEGAEVV